MRSMDTTEFGIAVLKPDAVEQSLRDEIVEDLRLLGLQLVAESRRHLTATEAVQLSLHPEKSYIAWLTSGPMHALLLSGAGAPTRLYEFKSSFREQKGVNHEIHNLLHTADDGTEYHRLLGMFFPELKLAAYCNPVDQAVEGFADNLSRITGSRIRHCVVGGGPAERQQVADWAHMHNANHVLFASRFHLSHDWIDAEIWDWDMDPTGRCSSFLPFRAVSLYTFPVDVIHDYGNITWSFRRHRVRGDRDRQLMELDFVRELRASLPEIQGMVCLRPELQLREAEFCMDVSRLLHWTRLGGSGRYGLSGEFGVSRQCLRGTPFECAEGGVAVR